MQEVIKIPMEFGDNLHTIRSIDLRTNLTDFIIILVLQVSGNLQILKPDL